jgi:hypothetical protein
VDSGRACCCGHCATSRRAGEPAARDKDHLGSDGRPGSTPRPFSAWSTSSSASLLLGLWRTLAWSPLLLVLRCRARYPESVAAPGATHATISGLIAALERGGLVRSAVRRDDYRNRLARPRRPSKMRSGETGGEVTGTTLPQPGKTEDRFAGVPRTADPSRTPAFPGQVICALLRLSSPLVHPNFGSRRLPGEETLWVGSGTAIERRYSDAQADSLPRRAIQ